MSDKANIVSVSRRDFLKNTAVAGATLAMAGSSRIFAQGTDKFKVGLIGAGGRGTGAALNCLEADPSVEIVAIGDLFQDRLDHSLNQLKANFADRIKVTPQTCFTGFDNFEKVLASDVNLIILATPPHFRPQHLEAAVKAGKHVFMEKPVAVDPVGIRRVIAASEEADKKGLGIVAGTQRRHAKNYIEVMKRIHDGAIGEIVSAQCYWNMGFLWTRKKEAGWSDMEWQIRNWLYFTWLSGDHIVEQHVHNLDVVNWAFDEMPKSAMGMGGRQVRTSPDNGNIFDHFAIEFEYPNGARTLSMCRQIDGCASNVSERIVGTKGVALPGSGKITGENPCDVGGSPNPYVEEHKDLIASIRAGKPLNEGKTVAQSTMTAILGRMSAYTGQVIGMNWAIKNSKLDLAPPAYEFSNLPVAEVAVPGKTPLV